MSVQRKGRCFDDSLEKLLSLYNPDPDLVEDAQLVHGLPMGRGGDAALVGRFPHAWVEWKGSCWEPATRSWWPANIYYMLGQIEYTVKYTRREAQEMMLEHEHYGPWDATIVERDEEISQEYEA